MELWVITILDNLGSPADCAFLCLYVLKYPLVTPGPSFVHGKTNTGFLWLARI